MITGFRSLILMCRDADACRAWYESVGFAYSHGYHGMHWLTVGDATIMLHPAEASSAGTWSMHVNVADVDALFAQVQAQGHEPVDHQQPGAVLTGPVTRAWGDREFELEDPEGHRWVFTQATSLA